MMTKYLEDYVIELNQLMNGYNPFVIKISNDWPESFIESIAQQIEDGRVLTTRQAATARNIINKVIKNKQFVNRFNDLADIQLAVQENRWKQSPRVSVERRFEARYIGGNHIVVSGYANNPEAKQMLKTMRAQYHYTQVVVLSVTRYNIEELIQLLGQFSVEIDNALEEYLALCLGSKHQISHFIAAGSMCAINICDDELLTIFMRNFCGAQDV